MHQAVDVDNKLKYAIIDLFEKKEGNTKVESGLLRGFNKDKDITFLWLINEKGVLKGCNLDVFNILMVHAYDGVTKTFTFFKADEDDQKEALKAVAEVLKGLKHLAIANGACTGILIDTSKFEDVPERLSSFSGTTINPGHTESPKTVVGQASYSSTVCKEPKPFAWKRETRKPTKVALEKLRMKLDLLAKGEYKTVIVKIKNDDKKEEYDGGDKKSSIYKKCSNHHPFDNLEQYGCYYAD